MNKILYKHKPIKCFVFKIQTPRSMTVQCVLRDVSETFLSQSRRACSLRFLLRWVRGPDIEIIAFSTARRANDIRNRGRFFFHKCRRKIVVYEMFGFIVNYKIIKLLMTCFCRNTEYICRIHYIVEFFLWSASMEMWKYFYILISGCKMFYI